LGLLGTPIETTATRWCPQPPSFLCAGCRLGTFISFEASPGHPLRCNCSRNREKLLPLGFHVGPAGTIKWLLMVPTWHQCGPQCASNVISWIPSVRNTHYSCAQAADLMVCLFPRASHCTPFKESLQPGR